MDRAVADLVGLHATDPATPYLSLWARLPGFTVADLDTALTSDAAWSSISRCAARSGWSAPTTCPTSRPQPVTGWPTTSVESWSPMCRRPASPPTATNGSTAHVTRCLAHLAENGPTNARQLRAALPELAGTYDPAPGKRWGGDTPLSPRVLTVLSVRGDIVRGPNEGTWTTSRPQWAAATRLVRRARPVSPRSKRRASELVRTWLRTFGPATVTDIKWWFGNTLTWARHALRDVDAVEVDLDGAPGFALPDDLEVEAEPDPWGALLPGLDVTTMGWYDRDWYLGGHRSQVFDTNGNAGPTAWWNGRVVGGWAQDADGRVELRLLEDVGRDAPQGADAAGRRADRLARRGADQPAIPVAAVDAPVGDDRAGAPRATTTGIDVAVLVRRIVCTTSTRSSTGISWPGMQPREIHCG